ncbi:hypothetical protein ACFSL6_00120 [Paenibacillus thailandensis]|uniref:hypothetical protein n=1 Tax=Paenibacillus thailandensis TaxID=393250 RepID=UPI00363E639D
MRPRHYRELQACGISAYAELGSGYFDARKVETVFLVAAAVIDKSVPGHSACGRAALAAVRTENGGAALIRTGRSMPAITTRVAACGGRLAAAGRASEQAVAVPRPSGPWREEEARQGSLTELLRQIYATPAITNLPAACQAAR